MSGAGHDRDRMVVGPHVSLATSVGVMSGLLLLLGGGLFVITIGIGELAAPEWLHRRLTLVSTEPKWLLVAVSFSSGLACMSVGLWAAFSWRGDVVLDRRDRTVTQRRGFPVTFRSVVRSLDGFKEVVVTVEDRGGFLCDVSLKGHSGDMVFLWTASDPSQAAAKAKGVAAFLGLPVRDAFGQLL